MMAASRIRADAELLRAISLLLRVVLVSCRSWVQTPPLALTAVPTGIGGSVWMPTATLWHILSENFSIP